MGYMVEKEINNKLDRLVKTLILNTRLDKIEWTRISDDESPFEYEFRVPGDWDYSVSVAMDSRGMYPRYRLSIWKGVTTVYEVCHSTVEEVTTFNRQVEELFTEVQLADPVVMESLDRMIENINRVIEDNKQQ